MRREESWWWREGFTSGWWDALPRDQRQAFLEALTDEEVESFFTDWRVWARDKQLRPPGDDQWGTWLALCGRGFGKSRMGSEWIRDGVERCGITRMCLLGQGEDDVREVMIEGPSGLLAISPKEHRPRFYPSVGTGHLIWPNGAVAYVYSAADPEALRGPQFQRAWVDEPLAFNPEARAKAMSNLRLGLRMLGPNGIQPQQILTSTPKPHRWLKELIKRAERDPKAPNGRIRITRGFTQENAGNLAETFMEDILDEYEGTALGRQELYAEILGDEDGALFQESTLDKYRIMPPPEVRAAMDRGDLEPLEAWRRAFARTCDKVVVGVDPNTTDSKTAHAAGIVVAGKKDGRRFTIGDYSMRGGPSKWSAECIRVYELFDADEMVVEVNQGGDLVKMVVEQEAKNQSVDIVFKKVRAWKGKARRAEPISAAYEAGKVSHLGTVGHEKAPGPLYMLERQLCALHDGHDPTGEDFDRADANNYAHQRLGRKRDDDSDASQGDGVGIGTFGDWGAAEAA